MAVKAAVHHRIPPLPDSYGPEDDADYGDDEPSSSSDDETDYSDDDDFKDGYSTPMTEPEPDFKSHPLAPIASQQARGSPAISSRLPKNRDEPDDDTDEDIAKVPLDYGRSGKTKINGARIEDRWHK